jgi:hypothetical protein
MRLLNCVIKLPISPHTPGQLFKAHMLTPHVAFDRTARLMIPLDPTLGDALPTFFW